jgi:hypothetical protein
MQKKRSDKFCQLSPFLALAQVGERGGDGHKPIGCGHHLASRRVRIFIFSTIIRVTTVGDDSTSPRGKPPQRHSEWRLGSAAIASWWCRRTLAESGLFAPTAIFILYGILYLIHYQPFLL